MNKCVFCQKPMNQAAHAFLDEPPITITGTDIQCCSWYCYQKVTVARKREEELEEKRKAREEKRKQKELKRAVVAARYCVAHDPDAGSEYDYDSTVNPFDNTGQVR